MNYNSRNSVDNNYDSSHDQVVLKDLLMIFFQKRAWFLLSVAVMVTLGVVYVKSKSNIYSRAATVIVEDERRGGSVSEAVVFQELFSMGSGSVYNEMGLFKSNRLMYEVVDRLNLEMEYKVREQLRWRELYRATPLKASFSGMLPTQRISMVCTPLSESQAQISEFTLYGELSKEDNIILDDMIVNFGAPITTLYGEFTLAPTLFSIEGYIGEPITIIRNSPKGVARAYNKKLEVEMIDKYASLLTISLSDENAQRAEDVINTLIQVYSDDAIDDKNRILSNTSKFIEERLSIIEADLTAVDVQIEEFKRKNSLTDGMAEGTMYLESMTRIDQQNLAVVNELTMAKYMKSYLEDESNVSQLLPVNVGVASVGLQQQIAEYNECMNRRNKLLLNSSESNPLVVDMQNVLVGMRISILQSINNLIASLEIQANNYLRKESESLEKIKDIPSQQKYIVSIERQQAIKESLYLYLLNKKEESELQLSITESNCRIVDSAEGSSMPVAPQKKVIVFAFLLLGLAIPAAVIYVINILNTAVATRKDIKDVVSVPFLGDIPSGGKLSPGKVLVVEPDSRSAVSEAFRVVRDNLDFISLPSGSGGRVVQFTSLNPNSGKTFTSLNLAMSMALGGAKVIVVDLDIRKATLSKIAGFNSKDLGVSQYLSGRVESLQQIIRPFADGGAFDVICSGALPPNPAELLKGARLSSMLEELRRDYQYIFVDNPPYGVVVDSAICARCCDQSIYVIRAGNFDKRLLPELQELYDQEKLPNMSLLLNDVKYQSASYGYGYGYGYGGEQVRKNWFKRILGI